MKSAKGSNLGEIRNELNRYKKGEKFDIHQFNQIARLAWLGKVSLQPLDPQDSECRAYLMHVDHLDGLPSHIINADDELLGHIFIVDGEQGDALVKTLRTGVEERARLYHELNNRDFYFRHFFQSDAGSADASRGASGSDSSE